MSSETGSRYLVSHTATHVGTPRASRGLFGGLEGAPQLVPGNLRTRTAGHARLREVGRGDDLVFPAENPSVEMHKLVRVGAARKERHRAAA